MKKYLSPLLVTTVVLAGYSIINGQHENKISTPLSNNDVPKLDTNKNTIERSHSNKPSSEVPIHSNKIAQSDSSSAFTPPIAQTNPSENNNTLRNSVLSHINEESHHTIIQNSKPLLVQSELPTAVISKKGEPLVQPELPEAVISEKGEPLVQPELPEAVIREKGEPLIQPELPEYKIPVTIHYEFGTPEIQPALPEFKIIRNVKTVNTPIPAPYVTLADMYLKKGENRIDFHGKNGERTQIIEEYVDENGTFLTRNVLSSNETKPIPKVIRYGTLTENSEIGESGLYNLREHFPNADIIQFNKNITLNGYQMKELSPEERYKKANENIENNLWLPGLPGYYTIANAPLSDDSIHKINDGTYLDHTLLGQEMLKLVNEERIRMGHKPLKWSDNLYQFTKIRAKEIGENGHIRFYNQENKAMPHTRDSQGKMWDTVFKDTPYEGRGYGENTAGYTLPRNIYQIFSEKKIAETIFMMLKNSPGHYQNMMHDGYAYFAFDINASKFWRNNKDNIDYLAQGIQGVQLFGGLNFE